jgi:hypothetical protein
VQCGGGERQRTSYKLKQKPISSETVLTSCRLGQTTRGCALRGGKEELKKNYPSKRASAAILGDKCIHKLWNLLYSKLSL